MTFEISNNNNIAVSTYYDARFHAPLKVHLWVRLCYEIVATKLITLRSVNKACERICLAIDYQF